VNINVPHLYIEMKLDIKKTFIVLILFILYPATLLAWSGECVAVTDGDTIKVMHEGKAEKIRLYGIDCPEKKQAFGKKAKTFASELVFKKVVEVKPLNKDRYGRTIAWVYVGDKCLNEELLKTGLGWHYKRYSKDKSLAILEEEAKVMKVGLWSDPHSVPPWEWRRLH